MAEDIDVEWNEEDSTATITTPLGTATLDISEDNEAADGYLAGESDWGALSDAERFRILIEEAQTGLDLHTRGKL